MKIDDRKCLTIDLIQAPWIFARAYQNGNELQIAICVAT